MYDYESFLHGWLKRRETWMEKFWRKMASVIIVLALILENILTSSAYAANYTFTGKNFALKMEW